MWWWMLPINYNLSQKEARKLVKKICKDFELPKCLVFYINTTLFDKEVLGLYSEEDDGLYAYMLIQYNWSHKLCLVLHEAAHHLQAVKYKNSKGHDKKFQLARKRIATWAKNNISKKVKWANLIRSSIDGRHLRVP